MACLRAPLEEPSMAGLVRSLADVNCWADRSPGFVWRHRSDAGPLEFVDFDGRDDVVVTLSVWDDFESLQRFVYRTAHGLFMRQ